MSYFADRRPFFLDLHQVYQLYQDAQGEFTNSIINGLDTEVIHEGHDVRDERGISVVYVTIYCWQMMKPLKIEVHSCPP